MRYGRNYQAQASCHQGRPMPIEEFIEASVKQLLHRSIMPLKSRPHLLGMETEWHLCRPLLLFHMTFKLLWYEEGIALTAMNPELSQ